MAVSFSIHKYSATSITVKVTPDSTYKYTRLFWRKSSTTSSSVYPTAGTGSGTNGDYKYSSSAWYYTISDLTPNTSYTFNVQYANHNGPAQSGDAYLYTSSNAPTRTTRSLPSTSFSLESTSPGEITVRITTTDSSRKYYKIWYRSSSGEVSQYPTSENSYSTFTSRTITVDPGELYYVSLDAASSSSWTQSNTCIVDKTADSSQSIYSFPDIDITVGRIWSDAIETTVTQSGSFKYRYLQWKTSSGSYSSSRRLPSSGYNSSSSWKPIATGLSPDTTYTFRVSAARSSSGTDLKTEAVTTSIKTAKASAGSFVRSTENSITCKVGSFGYYSDTRVVYFQAHLNGVQVSEANTGTIASYATSSPEVTITGLAPNTTYQIYCYVYLNGDKSTKLLNTFDASTSALAGTISYVSSTDTSITVKLTGLSTNSGKTRTISLDAYLNGVIVPGANGSGTVSSTSSSSGNITILNLSPGTTYTIKGYISFDGGTTYHYLGSSKDISATTTGTSLSLWSWTSANSTTNPAHTAEATASQTTAARDACRDKTAVSNFSYKVWNDLVWKVSEARVAGGDSAGWNNYYAPRENTLMSDTDKTLTAVRYNSLRYNIGTVYSVPDSKKIYEVSKGDPVGGTTHFLNFVTNYLNAYITQLRGGN